MSSYDEHLISQAGGDGDGDKDWLADIEDRAHINRRLGKTASQDEAKDTLRLIALVREQAAKLEAVRALVKPATRSGRITVILPDEVRAILEAS